MKKITIIIFLAMTMIISMGCDSRAQEYDYDYEYEDVRDDEWDDEYETEDIRLEHSVITAADAEEMMTDNVIILDVRNPDEFAEGHIPNAVLLPSDELWDNATSVLLDKDQVILVYCRSGVRSSVAAQELVLLGYTNVYDFGGISDWHGEIVTD